jgi:CheY-like chemotaxis protein
MSETHILLVDDDPVIRQMLTAHFQGRGFRCTAVADGAAALALLDREPADVLVTDLAMPGMDGLALLRAVRVSGLFTRCVVITGYATVSNLTACLREGATALVPKPLDDLAALDHAVDQALAALADWSRQMRAIVQLRPPTAIHRRGPGHVG